MLFHQHFYFYNIFSRKNYFQQKQKGPHVRKQGLSNAQFRIEIASELCAPITLVVFTNGIQNILYGKICFIYIYIYIMLGTEVGTEVVANIVEITTQNHPIKFGPREVPPL